MATTGAIEFLGAALLETASVMSTELAMFGAAALCYVFFVGGLPIFGKVGKPSSKKGLHAASRASAGGSAAAAAAPAPSPSSEARGALRAHAARGEWRAAAALWHRCKRAEGVHLLDLGLVVEALRRLRATPPEIAAELRAVASERPEVLDAVSKLPTTLAQDESADILDSVLALLEEFARPADLSAYAALMAAHLRRQRPEAVAAVAARAPRGAPTPAMRAMLGAAAAQQKRLDDAIGHLKEASVEAEACLDPAVVVQILALACAEGRIAEALRELARLRLALDPRSFEQLLGAEAGRGAAELRELLDAGVALGVPLRPASFQALATALAREEDAAGLRGLCDELELSSKGADGVVVSEPLSLAMLHACRAVGEASVASRVLELHRLACAGAPGGSVLGAYCALLAGAGRAAEACDFFEAEMAPRGLAPDVGLAAVLAEAAAGVGREDLASRLPSLVLTPKSVPKAPKPAAAAVVASQRPLRPRPQKVAASAPAKSGEVKADAAAGGSKAVLAIRACAKAGDLQGAEAAFEEGKAAAEEDRHELKALHGALLDARLRCDEGPRAEALWREMTSSELADAAAGAALAKWHLGAGRADAALAVVRDLTAAGLQAEAALFKDLLQIKVSQKDRRGVWQVVEELQRAGARPTGAFCAILLRSLTLHSAPEEVRRVAALIEDVDGSSDGLLAAVADAFLRIQRLDVLSEVMRRFAAKGARAALPSPTYSSLVKAYGQAGDVDRVRELWQEMAEFGTRPTSITVGCMVDALVSNGQAEQAVELLQKLLADPERRGTIGTAAYSTVLRGLAAAKQVDKAFEVYAGMRERGVTCNLGTYNALLDACAKASCMDRSAALLQDMSAAGLEPDIITFSTIIKGFCAQGDMQEAFSTLKDMKRQGQLQPDEIMYNTILDGCAKKHCVDEALELLEEMKQASIAPSNYTLSILVRLLGQARKLEEAFQTVEDLSKRHGLRPNVQVYTCLLQGCMLNKDLDRAVELHDTVVREGCALDDRFYGVLARGCLQLHQPLRAVGVVRAAYRLPGGGELLAAPGRGPGVGVDGHALEEVVDALRGGAPEEQQALEQLAAELDRLRGVRLLGDAPSEAGWERRGGRRSARGGRTGGGRQ